jgi:hypothetical protein
MCRLHHRASNPVETKMAPRANRGAIALHLEVYQAVRTSR